MLSLLVHTTPALRIFITKPRRHCIRSTIPPAAIFAAVVAIAIGVITAATTVRLIRAESGRVVIALLRIIAHAFAVTTFGAGASVAAVPAFARVIVAFVLPAAAPITLATAFTSASRR